MISTDPIVVIAAKRTAFGAFGGTLAETAAPTLGATAIAAAIESINLEHDWIDSVHMGCVLTAGMRQAPARQAAIGANLPVSTPCVTVNKVCGSSLQTIAQGAYELIATHGRCVVAGGMENMSMAPYLSKRCRFGQRLGHGELLDHMFYDGLENAYGDHGLMGTFAEATANKYKFSREDLDNFSIESSKLAQAAQEKGCFKEEIAPLTIKKRKNEITVSEDEGPQNARPDKIPTLRAAFQKDGVTTAGNSSSISDGAAAVILMRESQAKALNHKPLARIVGSASFAHEPAWFTTAPAGSITKLLQQISWSAEDVDLYEINEAFAVVTLATMHDLKLNRDQVNIYGGAVCLGHPIGATGARLAVTIINQLHREDKERGIISACIGGGEAIAIAFERM